MMKRMKRITKITDKIPFTILCHFSFHSSLAPLLVHPEQKLSSLLKIIFVYFGVVKDAGRIQKNSK